MREIKFRAWSGKQMFDYSYFSGIAWSYTRGDFDKPCPFDFGWQDDEFYEDYILMQYTGLKDKNDVEIYEGDICRAYKPNSYLDGCYAVVWDEQHGRWSYDYQTRPIRNYQVGKAGNIVCEVIGNIYENPELLEAK